MAAKEKKGSKRKAAKFVEKPLKVVEISKETDSDYEPDKVG